jgi:hypothetical protein
MSRSGAVVLTALLCAALLLLAGWMLYGLVRFAQLVVRYPRPAIAAALIAGIFTAPALIRTPNQGGAP